MKLKKVIAVIVVLAVTVGAVTGGIYGYKSYQKKNLVAEVQFLFVGFVYRLRYFFLF